MSEPLDEDLRWLSVVMNHRSDPGNSCEELYERAIAETLGPEAAERQFRFTERMAFIDRWLWSIFLPCAIALTVIWLALVVAAVLHLPPTG